MRFYGPKWLNAKSITVLRKDDKYLRINRERDKDRYICITKEVIDETFVIANINQKLEKLRNSGQ